MMKEARGGNRDKRYVPRIEMAGRDLVTHVLTKVARRYKVRIGSALQVTLGRAKEVWVPQSLYFPDPINLKVWNRNEGKGGV